MQRIVIFLLSAFLLANIIYGQRRLQIVADASESQPSTISLNGEIVIAGNGDSYLNIYNDEALETHNYPIVGGTALEFFNASKLCLFRSEVCMILWGDGLRYLYRFNGTVFRNITVPGRIVSTCITFGDNLYVLSEVEGKIRLFRYNGTAVSEVNSNVLPVTNSYDLVVGNNYLYLIGRGYYAGDPPDIIRRFDGVTISTLPYVNVSGGISQLLPVGETGRVYFFIGSRVVYFDGAAVSEIYDLFAGSNKGLIWESELYFISSEGSNARLYKAAATTVTEIMAPAGTSFFADCNLALYHDTLFTQIRYSDGRTEIMKYDGISFSSFFTPSGTVFSSARLFVRDGDLIIHPNFMNADNAIEYDGSAFVGILAPPGFILASYLNSTDCNFLWMSYHDDYRWTFLKESRDCPPPPPSAVTVIPEYFNEFEKVDLKLDGHDRGWCWSEIILDWINPICSLPPCPDPVFQVRFTDKAGKIAWQQKFEDPFDVLVPLKDAKPYRVFLSADINKSFQPIVVMDYDLVPKGIAGITLSMRPTQGYFKLSAMTDKGITIPLKATLINKKGIPIWEKTFMAPFSTVINDKIKEPGQVLYFTIPQTLQKTVEDPITSFSVYPNPSHGQLNLEIKTNGKTVDTEIIITSLYGETLLKKSIRAPFNQRLNLPACKPGLYVLKLKTTDGEMNKLIQLE